MHTDRQEAITIPTVTNDGRSASSFAERTITLSGNAHRHLSERIPAVNFRLRTSGPDYASGWHVAGDPTLLIILQGTLCVELRDDTHRTFSAGEMFIAEDHLLPSADFCPDTHGHRAKVTGGQTLQALHLKLQVR